MAIVKNKTPTTVHKAQKLSLNEFMKSAGDEKVNKLFSRFNGGTYMGCHVTFYEATGIWIPELVPVFQKMDAMTCAWHVTLLAGSSPDMAYGRQEHVDEGKGAQRNDGLLPEEGQKVTHRQCGI